MLVFFALGNAKVLSFALGDAKVPNANDFAFWWNIGFRLLELIKARASHSGNQDGSALLRMCGSPHSFRYPFRYHNLELYSICYSVPWKCHVRVRRVRVVNYMSGMCVCVQIWGYGGGPDFLC